MSQLLVPDLFVTIMLLLIPSIHILSSSLIEKNKITQNYNYLQTITFFTDKVNRIRLINKQIDQFNTLTLQIRIGSRTMG